MFAITVDPAPLIQALERLPEQILVRTKRASEVTANRIAAEARTRLAHQLSPAATGKTVAGILVDDDHEGHGYVVTSERSPFPNVPTWLEHGTAHMAARPYFDAPAQLEAGPHARRIEAAIQEAIDAEGLGH